MPSGKSQVVVSSTSLIPEPLLKLSFLGRSKCFLQRFHIIMAVCYVGDITYKILLR